MKPESTTILAHHAHHAHHGALIYHGTHRHRPGRTTPRTGREIRGHPLPGLITLSVSAARAVALVGLTVASAIRPRR